MPTVYWTATHLLPLHTHVTCITFHELQAIPFTLPTYRLLYPLHLGFSHTFTTHCDLILPAVPADAAGLHTVLYAPHYARHARTPLPTRAHHIPLFLPHPLFGPARVDGGLRSCRRHHDLYLHRDYDVVLAAILPYGIYTVLPHPYTAHSTRALPHTVRLFAWHTFAHSAGG